jgi:hypothetical protein
MTPSRLASFILISLSKVYPPPSPSLGVTLQLWFDKKEYYFDFIFNYGLEFSVPHKKAKTGIKKMKFQWKNWLLIFCCISLISAKKHHQQKPLPDQQRYLPEPYNSVAILPFDPAGFYSHPQALVNLFISLQPKVVIEVGCWLGLSTRHMASLLIKGGVVYAVDHWRGSTEHQPGQPYGSPKLPYLYEQFLSNVIHEGLTHRIIPVRMESLEASKFLSNLSPDLIYIDASHDYEAVYADIKAWFPLVKGHGILSGDDYTNGDGLPIKRAVDQFARENNLHVHTDGVFWYYTE